MSSDIKLEVIQSTQKILGKYVKKPPLTEKLLRKPPFRFLHDIVNTVISETGFLNGLFTEDEMKSENVKEKEAKLAYLNKLIDAIKKITGKNLSVRASKIIAGLEPTETNVLLQTIGRALNKKLDSSAYVAGLHGAEKAPKSKTKQSDKKSDTTNKTKSIKSEEQLKIKKKSVKADEKDVKKKVTSSDRKQKSNKKEEATPKSRDAVVKSKSSPKAIETPKEIEPITAALASTNNEESQDMQIPLDDHPEENKTNDAKEEENVKDVQKGEPGDKIKYDRSERPKSARPTSGDHKREALKSRERKENIVAEQKPVVQRPKSSLRPPSVRPSSARPGAPRLRPDSTMPMKEMVTMGNINVIVENFSNKDIDDDETVIVQSTEETNDDQPPILDMPESKGHLVEQILEQIEEAKDLPKTKTEIEWELGQQKGRDVVNKEIEQLRSSIQTLTKTANPLGKLLNYLHEDVEAIYGELEMWINTKRQIKSEIKRQKLINEESAKPLKSTLQQLQEDILKQEQEILNVRSNILRNEAQLKKLLA